MRKTRSARTRSRKCGRWSTGSAPPERVAPGPVFADLSPMADDKHTASPLFVTTDSLADRVGSRGLVVVNGLWPLPTLKRDGFAEYRIALLPAAVFFDIDEISDHSSDLPHMMPPPEAFALHM